MLPPLKALVVTLLVAGCVATTSAAQERSPFPRGWIVFTADTERGVYCCSLFKIRTDGTGLRVLASGGVVHDDVPGFSPDGTHVAFAAATYKGAGIFTMNLDGSGRGRVTTDGGDRSPAYSPDGKRIAFLRANDLYVVRFNSRGLRRLRRGFEVQGRPSWTPDGKSIVFSGSDRNYYDIYLYTVDARTGRIERQRLLQGTGGWECCIGDALLSPNGRTVVFFGEKPTCPDCDPASALYRTPYPRGPIRRVRYPCGFDSWSADSRVLVTGAGTRIDLCVLGDGRTKSVPVGGNVYAEYAALQPR